MSGDKFTVNGLTYYVGWMKSKLHKDDFGMWLNEQPSGGFKWEFLDFEPEDKENYRKIFILANDPRTYAIGPCPPHEWDRDGERCMKCGHKDWM